jgi:hypothetical protein
MDKPDKDKPKKPIFSLKSKKEKKDKKLAQQLADTHIREANAAAAASAPSRVQCPKCGIDLKVPTGSMRFLCGQCNAPLCVRVPDLATTPDERSPPAGSSKPAPSLFKAPPKQQQHPPHNNKMGVKPPGGINHTAHDKVPATEAATNLVPVAKKPEGADVEGSLEPPPTPGEPARPDSRAMVRSASDWRRKEVRFAVNAATKALATVSRVMNSDRGFKVLSDQAAANAGLSSSSSASTSSSSSAAAAVAATSTEQQSVFASVFGIVRNTLLVALSDAHDSFAAEKEAMMLVQLAATAGVGVGVGGGAGAGSGADGSSSMLQNNTDDPWAEFISGAHAFVSTRVCVCARACVLACMCVRACGTRATA